MFGYIRVFKPELRFKDFETYKGVYCNLCNCMGRNYGLRSRTVLNYDVTFILIIFLGLSNKFNYIESHKKFFCMCNKNQDSMNQDIYKAAAGASIILAYGKVYDNIYDSKLLKKFFYKFAKVVLNNSYKKAKRDFPYFDVIINNFMNKQISIEKNNNVNDITIFSEPTSIMLSEMFLKISDILKLDNDQKCLLEQFGYYLGRWIYFIDAMDDVKLDKIKGEFNPILCCNYNSNMIDYLSELLDECLVNMTNSYNEMRIYGYYEIIENILNFGLRRTQSLIIHNFKEDIKEIQFGVE